MKPRGGNLETIADKIAEVDRQLHRKISVLEKDADFTELLEESFQQNSVRLENLLQSSLSELAELKDAVDESILSLRRLADEDQSELISKLEGEHNRIQDVDHKLKLLLEMGELLMALESSPNEPDSCLEYLREIETKNSILNEWSNGKLIVLKNVTSYHLNKVYTLESERRRNLLKMEERSENMDFTDSVDEGSEEAVFLGKARDVLQKPMEPTETLSSEEFGGFGDIEECQVSFWLRPLLIECVNNKYLNSVLDMYRSIYKQLLPSYPLRSIAIFYCNSLFITHKVLLENIVSPSRISVDSATSLRNFAEQQLLRKIQEVKFESNTDTLDDATFKEYVKILKKIALDIGDTLPKNVSRKIISLLLDHYLKSIVMILLSIEDIESSQADRWSLLLGDITSALDGTMSGIPTQYLAKVRELKNILTYSLKDFAAKWKNMDSELRVCFQAREVRHFIKAIFQNSEMKSSVLAQIL